MEDWSLQEAIRRVGSKADLARAIGVSRHAVSQWRRVPAKRVLDVERITGVSRYRLRPDIYGTPEVTAPDHIRITTPGSR